jgi:hypothetical protein
VNVIDIRFLVCRSGEALPTLRIMKIWSVAPIRFPEPRTRCTFYPATSLSRVKGRNPVGIYRAAQEKCMGNSNIVLSIDHSTLDASVSDPSWFAIISKIWLFLIPTFKLGSNFTASSTILVMFWVWGWYKERDMVMWYLVSQVDTEQDIPMDPDLFSCHAAHMHQGNLVART